MSSTPVPHQSAQPQHNSITEELLDRLDAARRAENRVAVQHAENALTMHFLGFADSCARRFARRGVEPEDLTQVARIGLVKAVKGWRPQPGGGFLQYATPMVVGEVKRWLRDHGSPIRLPRAIHDNGVAIATAREDLLHEGTTPDDKAVAHVAGLSVRQVEEDRRARKECAAVSLEALRVDGEVVGLSDHASGMKLVSPEDVVMLRDAIRTLPARQRKLLGLRFFRGRTQEEIGRTLGVSQMQVSRLLRATLTSLRGRLETVANESSRSARYAA